MANPAIHKAFDVLETLSADEKNRHLAQMREDALRNERSELFYAEKKGLKKDAEKDAKKDHKKANLSAKFIFRRCCSVIR